MALSGLHHSGRFKPLAPLLLTAMLYGCGGEVTIDDGIVRSLDCSAQVSVPDNGEGLTRNANYQGLKYYALGTNLCAFDSSAGTAFEVDRATSGPVTEAFTLYTQNTNAIRGLVYVRDNHLRFTPTGQFSASAPPSPEQISSENRADEIDQLFAGFDRSDRNRVSIAYRLPGSNGSDEWFAVELSQGSTEPPTPFGPNRRPLGPVNSASGELSGWILHDTAEDKDALVFVSINSVDEPGETLASDLDSTSVNYMVQLSDGGSILSVVRSDETAFFHFPPGTASANPVGTIPAEVGGSDSAFSTNGEVLYVGQTVSDEEGENQAVLYRIGPDEFREIDRSGPNNTVPAQVTATDSAVVWAWNTRISEATPNGEGPSGVFLVDDNNAGEVFTIKENPAEDNSLVFSSLARGSQNNHVYFTERNRNTGSGYRAIAADTNNLENLKEFPVNMERARWVGSSQPAGVFQGIGVTPPTEMSEVFLTRRTSNGAELMAFDAGNPGDAVVLGPVRTGTSSIPPAPPITAFGLGPHRLIQSGNDLRVLDTRHSNSQRTLATDSSFQPVIETFPGF